MDKLRGLFPCGFYETDRQGRPLMLVDVGNTKVQELLDAFKADVLVRHLLRELEHTWRTKFEDCTSFVYKEGVDQMVAIIDLNGVKLKDLSNKQLNVIFRTCLIEFLRYYPEMLHKAYILSAPMFFQSIYENEVLPHLPEGTSKKIIISGENTHPDLLASFDLAKLPSLYGGQAEAEATCVHADKGPWNDVENKINFSTNKEEFKFYDDD